MRDDLCNFELNWIRLIDYITEYSSPDEKQIYIIFYPTVLFQSQSISPYRFYLLLSSKMANPFSDLSPDNHDQVLKYLRFFRQKRDGVLREMLRELDDIKSDRLDEDMFSREEAHEYADYVASAVRVSNGTQFAVGIYLSACFNVTDADVFCLRWCYVDTYEWRS